MERTSLTTALLVYTVVAAGVTVVPLAFVIGRAIVLFLIAALFVVSILHARAGSSPSMSMEGGGGESDFTEIDAAQSRIDTLYSLPGDGRTALTFYLLGVVLWSIVAVVVVV